MYKIYTISICVLFYILTMIIFFNTEDDVIKPFDIPDRYNMAYIDHTHINKDEEERCIIHTLLNAGSVSEDIEIFTCFDR